MGQVLHGSATTTEAIRRAIKHIQASLKALSKRGRQSSLLALKMMGMSAERYGQFQLMLGSWQQSALTPDGQTAHFH